MLGGTSPEFTLLSNDNFWDPKKIQLFEPNKKSTNRPDINDKILRYKSKKSDFDIKALENAFKNVNKNRLKKTILISKEVSISIFA